MKSTGFREIVAHDCYHICFPKSCCVGKHAWLVLAVSRWMGEDKSDLDYVGEVVE